MFGMSGMIGYDWYVLVCVVSDYVLACLICAGMFAMFDMSGMFTVLCMFGVCWCCWCLCPRGMCLVPV